MSVPSAPPRFYPRPIHDVLRELGYALFTIEQQLAVVSDTGNDAHELAVVLPRLIEARDVCALTGLNGPHLLLVEMVRVVDGVIEGEFEHATDATAALMFAAAKLPGYVQRLALGGRDVPLVLMPVLNDLRVVRGAALLSDSVMRLPLFRLPPDDLGASSSTDTLSATAQRVRPHFMRALLALIRGEPAASALDHLAWSLNTLRDASRRRSVRMLWLIMRAVIDGLRVGALELKPATKAVLGQIERCIKLAVEHGERDLVVSLPPELLRNLLYYCAQAGDASDVLTVVRQRYRLDDLLALTPDTDDAVERARQSLAPGLLSAARDQVQGELERVRDAVLAFAHSDVSADETLRPAGLLLERVCETLGVLGMSSARTTLVTSVPMFRGIRDRHTNARALAALAEVLLQGSRLLDSELDRLSSAPDDLDCSQELDVEQSALSRMPREERKQLLQAVIAQLREALDSFEEALTSNRTVQTEVTELAVREACDGLRDANRALEIVSLRAAHDAFGRLVSVLGHIEPDALRAANDSHPVVRTVAALDLYLRSLEDNDLNGRGFLRACFTSLTEIEQQVASQIIDPPEGVSDAPEATASQHERAAGSAAARARENRATEDPLPQERLPEGRLPEERLPLPTHTLDGVGDTPQYACDADLRAIFVAEAGEQLVALRARLEQRLDEAGGLLVDDPVRHLIDALVQRARLAEVGAVAEPLVQLDRVFAHYQRSSASVPAIEMALVERTLASIERSLDNLSVHRACDPAAVELHREWQGLGAVLGLAVHEDDSEVTDDLRAVFNDEAEELLASASAALADWQVSPGDTAASQRLMRALHTLKGSARVACADAVADTAHTLETVVAGGVAAPGAAAVSDLDRIQLGLDRIAEQLSGADVPPEVEAPAAPALSPEPASTPTPIGAAPVDPLGDDTGADVSDDTLRVSSQEVGALSALASDVALHRAALNDRLIDAQDQLDELARLIRRVEEHARTVAAAQRAGDLPQGVQESLRDFDTVQQSIRDQLRMSRAALDAQRQSGTALHDGLLKLRLVRFSSIVPRLQRLVRQTAAAAGKTVSLSVTSGDLTVDRGLLARLVGPLEHLVRNAVVHGIEPTDTRLQRNKDARGRVVLQAFQQHGSVQIRVADDGGGIDLARVRAAATARGLDLPGDDDALVHLILSPGFSTADAVDAHAGRGVGLDVVNRQVREAGGNLSIQTQPGAGAVFGLRVPQSLSIEKVVIVRAGDQRFAVPVSQVVSVEQVPNDTVRDAYIKAVASYGYGGASFPIQHLGELLGIAQWQPEGADEHAQLILMDVGEQRVALHVDGVVGQRELPVRGGGTQLQKLRGYSGASVLADGDVVLVLDVAGLLLERAGHEALVEIGDETRVLATAVASCVMVVDDSVTMRRANAHVLGKGGYRVVRARNGLDALQQLEVHPVDAFVLDLDMPGMDGFELLRRLRGDAQTASAPVVVVSSQNDPDSRARVAAFGVDYFLDKPCSGRLLLDAVDRAMQSESVV
ncbi:MAG: response regulator [Pseudomonadota bacterium]